MKATKADKVEGSLFNPTEAIFAVLANSFSNKYEVNGANMHLGAMLPINVMFKSWECRTFLNMPAPKYMLEVSIGLQVLIL